MYKRVYPKEERKRGINRKARKGKAQEARLSNEQQQQSGGEKWDREMRLE